MALVMFTKILHHLAVFLAVPSSGGPSRSNRSSTTSAGRRPRIKCQVTFMSLAHMKVTLKHNYSKFFTPFLPFVALISLFHPTDDAARILP